MHKKHWEDCLSIIKDNINSQSFTTWFKPIKSKSFKDMTLTLVIPNKFFYEWIEGHYLKLLNDTIITVLGEKGKIEYEVSNETKTINEETSMN